MVHLPGFVDDDWLERLEAVCAQQMTADPAELNLVGFTALAPMIEASGP